MLEILKAFRAEVNRRFDAVDARLEQIEDVQRKHRRNAAGMLVMMQATAGDFDERVTEVERRMEELERKVG